MLMFNVTLSSIFTRIIFNMALITPCDLIIYNKYIIILYHHTFSSHKVFYSTNTYIFHTYMNVSVTSPLLLSTACLATIYSKHNVHPNYQVPWSLSEVIPCCIQLHKGLAWFICSLSWDLPHSPCGDGTLESGWGDYVEQSKSEWPKPFSRPHVN